jgi:hypothetical protein
MMKHPFYLLMSLLFLPFLLEGQGLNLLTAEELVNYEAVELNSAGYAASLPSKHDMLKYAPPPLVQSGGTCVGFSTAYCAHSTMINKATETTDPLHKFIVSFDPYYIYSIVNSQRDEPCEEGLDFPMIFDAMERIGSLRDLFPPDLNCDFSWLDPATGEFDEDLEIYAAASMPFRIAGYKQIDLGSEDALYTMRYLLANDIPVIIGAAVNDDFSPVSYGGQIDANGVWNYKASNNGELAGHAMCILGYDDRFAGGSFLVRNSWGEDFGVGGNFWLKYHDIADVVSEAWCILPDFWEEYIYQPNEYGFDLLDTGFEGIEYMRITADDGSSTYEGFVAEDVRVSAFEIYHDGGVYFGQWVNFVKDGYGVYWDEQGDTYAMLFVEGELMNKEMAGFGSGNVEGDSFMRDYVRAIAGDDGMRFTGRLPGAFGAE